MAEDTGGPAFPEKRIDSDGMLCFDGGMTLRDWFAAQAAAGLTSACNSEGAWTADLPEIVAETAYSIAAAMVAEKRRREQS